MTINFEIKHATTIDGWKKIVTIHLIASFGKSFRLPHVSPIFILTGVGTDNCMAVSIQLRTMEAIFIISSAGTYLISHYETISNWIRGRRGRVYIVLELEYRKDRTGTLMCNKKYRLFALKNVFINFWTCVGQISCR